MNFDIKAFIKDARKNGLTREQFYKSNMVFYILLLVFDLILIFPNLLILNSLPTASLWSSTDAYTIVTAFFGFSILILIIKTGYSGYLLYEHYATNKKSEISNEEYLNKMEWDLSFSQYTGVSYLPGFSTVIMGILHMAPFSIIISSNISIFWPVLAPALITLVVFYFINTGFYLIMDEFNKRYFTKSIKVTDREKLEVILKSLPNSFAQASKLINTAAKSKSFSEINSCIQEIRNNQNYNLILDKKSPKNDSKNAKLRETIINLVALFSENVSFLESYKNQVLESYRYPLSEEIRPGSSISLANLQKMYQISTDQLEEVLHGLDQASMLPGIYQKTEKRFVKTFEPEMQFEQLSNYDLEEKRKAKLEKILAKVDYLWINDALNYLEFNTRMKFESWLASLPNNSLFQLTEDKLLVRRN